MSRVLVLNAGSATLKFGLYEQHACRRQGLVERLARGSRACLAREGASFPR